MGKQIERTKRKIGEKCVGFLFVLPSLIKSVVFSLTLIAACAVLGFTDYSIVARKGVFVGFENYVALFSDPVFLQSIYNTVFLMLGIPIGFFLSFLLAYALNGNSVRGKGFFRVVYYLPAVSSVLAIGVVWKWILNDEFGIINRLLNIHVGWMSDPKVVKISLIMKGVWGGLGGNMLMLLAGMQGINVSLMEYAELEGANPFQKMFRIVLPLLGPVFFYMTIVSVIGGLNAFSDNYIVLSSHETNTMIYFLYDKMQKTGEFGMVCAGSTFVGLTVFLITLLQFRVRARGEAKR